MSIYLRILLIIACILTSQYVIKKIRQSQMKIEGALFWLFFSFLVLVLSFFPNIGIALSRWIGIESAANFIFLVIIFLLIIQVFTLSIKLSKIEYNLSIVVEELSILQNKVDKQNQRISQYEVNK